MPPLPGSESKRRRPFSSTASASMARTGSTNLTRFSPLETIEPIFRTLFSKPGVDCGAPLWPRGASRFGTLLRNVRYGTRPNGARLAVAFCRLREKRLPPPRGAKPSPRLSPASGTGRLSLWPRPGATGPKGRHDEVRALACDRLQELLRRRRVQDRIRLDRRRRTERLRQVESGRGPALGDGRELVQGHARLGHGRRHLLGLRQDDVVHEIGRAHV